MEEFASQDPRSYSLYFDWNIWFRARKVTGTFEKRPQGRPDYDVLHTKRAYSMYRPSAFSIALPEEDWRDIRCILNEEEWRRHEFMSFFFFTSWNVL